MTRLELIEAIETGSDIMLKIGDRGFTILAWRDGGPDIGERNKPETVRHFGNAKALVDGYTINGKSLGELADRVVITEFS